MLSEDQHYKLVEALEDLFRDHECEPEDVFKAIPEVWERVSYSRQRTGEYQIRQREVGLKPCPGLHIEDVPGWTAPPVPPRS
jgi:hypothetical protein